MPTAKAARIFALETKIAQAHVSRVDSEDVHKANNPWKRADFASRAPGLDWNAYFTAADLGDQQNYVVWQPHAVTGISALVASEPVDVWKDYLAFHLFEHYGSVLPKAFVDERFAFYGTTLSGTPKIRDRWKRAIDATNFALGEAVGKLYAARYFPPAAKAKIDQTMVKELLAAYHARISNLKWMSPQTKEKALAKLATLRASASAIRTNGATIPPCTDRARRCARQSSQLARRCSSTSATSPSCMARSIAVNGRWSRRR